MTGPESKIQNEIIRRVKAAGIPGLVHFQLQIRGRRGWPDDFFAANGRVVLVECKRERGGKISPQQWKVMEQLRDAGLMVYIGVDVNIADLVISDLFNA